jgi:hypothetical protein
MLLASLKSSSAQTTPCFFAICCSGTEVVFLKAEAASHGEQLRCELSSADLNLEIHNT